jgi:hypothetical protein
MYHKDIGRRIRCLLLIPLNNKIDDSLDEFLRVIVKRHGVIRQWRI